MPYPLPQLREEDTSALCASPATSYLRNPFRFNGLVLAVLFHIVIFGLLSAISFANIRLSSRDAETALVVLPCEFNVVETKPYVEMPHFGLREPKMLTPRALDIPVPALEIPVMEPPVTVNGFRDAEDGGTAANNLTPRSGGGGGDSNNASLEFGHIGDFHWKAHARQNVEAAGASTSDGTAEKSAGTLSSPGAGDGFGNGKGAGALLSTGSGSGFGAGTNGSGAGNGTGKAAPRGITREPEALSVFGGDYPHAAKRARREGVVTLRVEVLADGRVGDVAMQQSSGSGDLDQAALQTAKSWSFYPALSDGQPVVSWALVPIRYVLTNSR